MSWQNDLQRSLTGKRVFLTGHTGFKGSWLSAWLLTYGCKITGYSLEPDTEPSLFRQLNLEHKIHKHIVGDIRDFEKVDRALQESRPELVVHMAAQPLVRLSYLSPNVTWDINLMGTVNVLEAVRGCESVRAVTVITTDKCYRNNEWVWGYRETDSLGGHDPYSASKAGAELAVESYRNSFFDKSGPILASARAGNVIGGGDWSKDRIIPDLIRAIKGGHVLEVRNPNATRPWQHVLDCLQGYLMLSARLLDRGRDYAGAYNFGPSAADNIRVHELVSLVQSKWREFGLQVEFGASETELHEANLLYLDSSLSRHKLEWRPRFSLTEAIEKTFDWYRAALESDSDIENFTEQQLKEYLGL